MTTSGNARVDELLDMICDASIFEASNIDLVVDHRVPPDVARMTLRKVIDTTTDPLPVDPHEPFRIGGIWFPNRAALDRFADRLMRKDVPADGPGAQYCPPLTTELHMQHDPSARASGRTNQTNQADGAKEDLRAEMGRENRDSARVKSLATTGRDPLEGLDFGQALRRLRQGGKVSRAGWNGRGQYLQLALPESISVHGRTEVRRYGSYIEIRPTSGEIVPWTASQTDLLALDWCEVNEKTVLVYGDGDATLAAGERSDRLG